MAAACSARSGSERACRRRRHRHTRSSTKFHGKACSAGGTLVTAPSRARNPASLANLSSAASVQETRRNGVRMKLRSLTVLLVAGPACAAGPTLVEQRIQRFQDALLPPVLVRGETPAVKSLGDRMAELKVPGVSIAVIDGGRIDWARGFG